MTESDKHSKTDGHTGPSAKTGEAGSSQENCARDPRRDRLLRGLKDDARFLKNWASRPLTTGAVSPSGKALAERMARTVDLQSDLPVVELGPGTGAVTKALLQRGVPPQRIIALEFNRDFCKLLRNRFPGCRILQGDAYALGKTLQDHGITQAACFVSSLPLFTRPLADRIALINAALSLMPRGGEFIQFSYALVPPVRSGELQSPCELNVSPWIMLNLPPARVWRYATIL
uniref:class I SAM-dependent methyltransferase n=1 Tax=Pararhizobium sp. IMCC3301 TaxID=3067904 RepID=UPI00274296B4|nr:rRNA adenine N-6-methyltransferase family protein [Pararhizobium sp. IMCC3301]